MPRLGKITLWATVDGKPGLIETELAGQEYNIAVEAHRQELPLRLRGILDQQNKKWLLSAARDVEFWREQDDAEDGDDDDL